MRLLFGIVLGVLLTIGGAYIHDRGSADATTTTAERPMVNWDVVSVKWHGLTEGAKHQWDRVTANINSDRAVQGNAPRS